MVRHVRARESHGVIAITGCDPSEFTIFTDARRFYANDPRTWWGTSMIGTPRARVAPAVALAVLWLTADADAQESLVGYWAPLYHEDFE